MGLRRAPPVPVGSSSVFAGWSGSQSEDDPAARHAASHQSVARNEQFFMTASSFEALRVPGDLAGGLREQGIPDPFPIQTLTIPDALAGRDVCGKAKTGSGKPLAFGLPMIQRLAAPAGDASRR